MDKKIVQEGLDAFKEQDRQKKVAKAVSDINSLARLVKQAKQLETNITKSAEELGLKLTPELRKELESAECISEGSSVFIDWAVGTSLTSTVAFR